MARGNSLGCKDGCDVLACWGHAYVVSSARLSQFNYRTNKTERKHCPTSRDFVITLKDQTGQRRLESVLPVNTRAKCMALVNTTVCVLTSLQDHVIMYRLTGSYTKQLTLSVCSFMLNCIWEKGCSSRLLTSHRWHAQVWWAFTVDLAQGL